MPFQMLLASKGKSALDSHVWIPELLAAAYSYNPMKRKRRAKSTAHAPNAASTAWLFLPCAQVFSCREIGAQMQVILYPYRLVEYDDADNFFFNCWELVACQYANEWPEYNGRNRNNACHESQLSAVQFRSESGIHPEDVDCVIHFVTQFYFTIF